MSGGGWQVEGIAGTMVEAVAAVHGPWHRKHGVPVAFVVTAAAPTPAEAGVGREMGSEHLHLLSAKVSLCLLPCAHLLSLTSHPG
jgi:hypothetical protein